MNATPVLPLKRGCHRVTVVPKKDPETGWAQVCPCCGAFSIPLWSYRHLEKPPPEKHCSWCLQMGHGEGWSPP